MTRSVRSRARRRPEKISRLGQDQNGAGYPLRNRRYAVGAISTTALNTRVK
jgi:hypothetical protein